MNTSHEHKTLLAPRHGSNSLEILYVADGIRRAEATA